MTIYSGMVSFKLKNFLADKSLNTIVNVGNPTDEDWLDLKKLHDEDNVGVIICSKELLQDLQNLIQELKNARS